MYGQPVWDQDTVHTQEEDTMVLTMVLLDESSTNRLDTCDGFDGCIGRDCRYGYNGYVGSGMTCAGMRVYGNPMTRDQDTFGTFTERSLAGG
jgi:hypothetical protein